MYENFKADFITNLNVMDINLNEEQINKVLLSVDSTIQNYDIYEKPESQLEANARNNGIPKLVYTYLSCKQAEGLARETLYGYKVILEIFFKTVPKYPDQVNANDIRVFLYNYQNKTKISNRSLDKYREYLMRFFTWLHENGEIPINISKQVKPIHYETPQREALTPYELEELRLACVTNRDKAIIEFLYSTACRVSELIEIKFSDIDWNNNTVHIFGKGQKHRTSFLNARARVMLEQYINYGRTGDSEYIFVSERSPHGKLTKEAIEKVIRQIASRAEGIHKHVTPHVIRHTTATIGLHNGMSINELSMLLGHSNIETTMIYAKTSYDAVKSAHNKYIV
jgi:integrase/recombinase XerD